MRSSSGRSHYKRKALCCAASVGVQATNVGVQDFLNSLRDFESGINPTLAGFYLQNQSNPV